MTKNSAMKTARPFLIGHRRKASTTTVPMLNPFTGQVVAEVCQAGKAEADEAMQESVAAHEAMRRLPAHARVQALNTIANGPSFRVKTFHCLRQFNSSAKNDLNLPNPWTT